MALILPESSHPYSGGPKRASFDAVFGPSGRQLLSDMTRVCLTDAVYNTALAWQDVWAKVGKEEK